MTSDRATGLAFIGVISQTEARLDKYVEFLARRRKVTNLTSERAFSQVWTRHLADCAQLLGYAPFARRCVDLGSGAGFPEMVVAILLAEMQGARKFIALKVIRENARSYGGSLVRPMLLPARRSYRNVRSLLVVTCGRSHLSGTGPLA